MTKSKIVNIFDRNLDILSKTKDIYYNLFMDLTKGTPDINVLNSVNVNLLKIIETESKIINKYDDDEDENGSNVIKFKDVMNLIKNNNNSENKKIEK